MKGRSLFLLAKSLLQFFPLSIFVAYAFWDGVPTPVQWLQAFMIGGLTAFFQLIFLAKSPKPFNRLILGANTYLIIGAFATVFSWIHVLEVLDSLREVGVLLCIFAVGVITTVGSQAGFIGVLSLEKKTKVRSYSVILLIATSFALLASVFYKGDFKFSAVLPILVLVFINRFLAKKITVTPLYD